MKEIYKLDVYCLAEELSDLIWYDFDTWTVKAQKTIGYQIIRSSDSIAANLAEGYGRFTMPDRKKFYLYSRGSFEETKAWLRKAIRRKIISSKSKIEQYQKMPILMLTTEISQQKKAQAKKLGITGWIQKPFVIYKFVKIISKVVN